MCLLGLVKGATQRSKQKIYSWWQQVLTPFHRGAHNTHTHTQVSLLTFFSSSSLISALTARLREVSSPPSAIRLLTRRSVMKRWPELITDTSRPGNRRIATHMKDHFIFSLSSGMPHSLIINTSNASSTWILNVIAYTTMPQLCLHYVSLKKTLSETLFKCLLVMLSNLCTSVP